MQIPPRMRGAAAVAGWAVAAAAVAAVSSFAVTALDADLSGSGRSEPLSVAEVNARLAATGYNAKPQPAATNIDSPAVVPGTGTGASTPSLGLDVDRRVAPSPGGSVVFRCSDSSVVVVSLYPALGYSTEDQPGSGPTDHARIRFESSDKRFVVDIRCNAGVPAVEIDSDDR